MTQGHVLNDEVTAGTERTAGTDDEEREIEKHGQTLLAERYARVGHESTTSTSRLQMRIALPQLRWPC